MMQETKMWNDYADKFPSDVEFFEVKFKDGTIADGRWLHGLLALKAPFTGHWVRIEEFYKILEADKEPSERKGPSRAIAWKEYDHGREDKNTLASHGEITNESSIEISNVADRLRYI